MGKKKHVDNLDSYTATKTQYIEARARLVEALLSSVGNDIDKKIDDFVTKTDKDLKLLDGLRITITHNSGCEQFEFPAKNALNVGIKAMEDLISSVNRTGTTPALLHQTEKEIKNIADKLDHATACLENQAPTPETAVGFAQKAGNSRPTSAKIRST